MHVLPLLIASVIHAFVTFEGSWEISRHSGIDDRPEVIENTVEIFPETKPAKSFPRYFNQLEVKRIRVKFKGPAHRRRKFSIVWTGGSQGPDRFEVIADGITIGTSHTAEPRYPYRWNLDEFEFRLSAGTDHVLEIVPVSGFESEIEFAGMRLAKSGSPPYRPVCYDSIGSLARYEESLGERGARIDGANLTIFVPKKRESEARALATLVDRAFDEMVRIFGAAPVFRFVIEHYPDGHERGWGGISGAGTIGYPLTSLDNFTRYKTRDVRGIAGYTEEMCHGFKALYRCGGTSEALGLVIQEDVVRQLVSKRAADTYWKVRHEQWKETTAAFRSAGFKNPDLKRYPENIFLYRLLCQAFHELRLEYGPDLWPDFFATLRQMDFPFHRAEKDKRLAIYADAFSILFGRDINSELTTLGFDLETGSTRGGSSSNE